MKVGSYIRSLIDDLKKERGIDGHFEERREVGVGYEYYIYVWTDEEKRNRKRRTFVLTDEFLDRLPANIIEKQIKDLFDELVEEFVAS
jgi:tRNA U55 pseudouridine synthase TruB